MKLEQLPVSDRPAPGILAAVREAFRGSMPPRYGTDLWDRRFRAAMNHRLAGEVRILDVGAGARPVLSPKDRPPGSRYVGLDISAGELAKAPADSYDDTVVADITASLPALHGRFDLVVSWMALEHVKPLAAALESIHACLRPGGGLVAQVPGAFTPAALANRAIPASLARSMLARIQDRDPATVFPARYDHCSQRGLSRLLAGRWAEWTVTPLYTGAGYVASSRLARAAYIAYEEWAFRRERHNLAPYYLLIATRDSGSSGRTMGHAGGSALAR